MVACGTPAFGITKMGVAAANIENLGLPTVDVTQLRYAGDDQSGGERERLFGRSQAAHMHVQPAQTYLVQSQGAASDFSNSRAIHAPFVMAAVGGDFGRLRGQRGWLDISEWQDADIDRSTQAPLSCELGNGLQFFWLIDIDGYPVGDCHFEFSALLVAAVEHEALRRNTRLQTHCKLAQTEAVAASTLYGQYSPYCEAVICFVGIEKRHFGISAGKSPVERTVVGPDLLLGGYVEWGAETLRDHFSIDTLDGKAAVDDSDKGVLGQKLLQHSLAPQAPTARAVEILESSKTSPSD